MAHALEDLCESQGSQVRAISYRVKPFETNKQTNKTQVVTHFGFTSGNEVGESMSLHLYSASKSYWIHVADCESVSSLARTVPAAPTFFSPLLSWWNQLRPFCHSRLFLTSQTRGRPRSGGLLTATTHSHRQQIREGLENVWGKFATVRQKRVHSLPCWLGLPSMLLGRGGSRVPVFPGFGHFVQRIKKSTRTLFRGQVKAQIR